jgi:ABC-type branched-subunit amino acid transport system ATPase component
MLKLDKVDARRGDSQILHGVSMEVAPGEMVALIGRNGMGKTTLLRAVLGLCEVTSGTVQFDGQDLRKWPTHMIARLGIGVVPEGRGMFPSLTVRENLVMGMPRSRTAAAAIDSAYDRFPLLRGRAGDRAGSLSGGQQQVLAIARALVAKPRLLLIDEFSDGIQPNLVEEIARMLQSLGDDGVSVLLVEQNARLALSTAQRGYILEKGRVVVEGKSEQILQDGELLAQHLVV